MEVYHEMIEGVLVVAPDGRIDSATSAALEQRLQEISPPGTGPMILDMSAVSYISSAGLRIILALSKRSAAEDGALALHGLSANIRKVFDVSGFSTILSIHDSREAALAAVNG